MKFCKKCDKEVRIRKHDGICPICGTVIDEKTADKVYGKEIVSEKESDSSEKVMEDEGKGYVEPDTKEATSGN